MTAAQDKAAVRAGARLHLGLVKISDEPVFLAAGLCLQEPFSEISVTRVAKPLSPSGGGRAANVVRTVCEALGVPPRFSARVDAALPSHHGFGSGTRHDLSIARAVCRLAGIKVSAKRLARILGRGRRSMMGTVLFSKGGFAADTGRRILSHPVRAEWTVVLIAPRISSSMNRSIHSRRERIMIASSPAVPPKAAGPLTDAMEEMAAAVAGNEFAPFERSVACLQKAAMKQFGPRQGGIASTGAGVRILRYLRRQGLRAVGQSSWGPALFAVLPASAETEFLARRLRRLESVRDVQTSKIAGAGYTLRHYRV